MYCLLALLALGVGTGDKIVYPHHKLIGQTRVIFDQNYQLDQAEYLRLSTSKPWIIITGVDPRTAREDAQVCVRLAKNNNELVVIPIINGQVPKIGVYEHNGTVANIRCVYGEHGSSWQELKNRGILVYGVNNEELYQDHTNKYIDPWLIIEQKPEGNIYTDAQIVAKLVKHKNALVKLPVINGVLPGIDVHYDDVGNIYAIRLFYDGSFKYDNSMQTVVYDDNLPKPVTKEIVEETIKQSISSSVDPIENKLKRPSEVQ
jgi:hypothetical protein